MGAIKDVGIGIRDVGIGIRDERVELWNGRNEQKAADNVILGTDCILLYRNKNDRNSTKRMHPKETMLLHRRASKTRDINYQQESKLVTAKRFERGRVGGWLSGKEFNLTRGR